MIGRTGGGFSDAQRLALVDHLAKRGADSSNVEVNSERVADKMIEPGLVAEIDCLDILSQTSDGSDIERNVGEVGGDLARGIEHGGQYPDPLTM